MYKRYTSTSLRWTVKLNFYSTGWLHCGNPRRWNKENIVRCKEVQKQRDNIVRLALKQSNENKDNWEFKMKGRKKVLPVAFGMSAYDPLIIHKEIRIHSFNAVFDLRLKLQKVACNGRHSKFVMVRRSTW